jgi:hypothetical protein
LIRFDGVTERRAGGGTAVGVPGGNAHVGMIGLPVRPSGGDAALWFRMIRPVKRDHLDDLRLVSRMSDNNKSCRVLSLAPFPCNDLKQPLGQAATSGWVSLKPGERATLDQI